ncbi:lactate racemase domain-containing protein [Candidatus Caldatribacterium sp.]|uniref:lactate racemase domain-containing protein n=1 Tax=Candidatus Caldatribacterium sp. TaxID=2282143 RepID=UPI002999E2A7|nr:lactate racemase domain-containing protein [Candidatus Caldatribacterium sp.]MDW8081969.1 lactate racemase domain-containing protein [Candidatus Calescibacterium sp.]
MILFGKGDTERTFSFEETQIYFREALSRHNWRKKKVLGIIPDNTRTAPVRIFFEAALSVIKPEAKRLDFLIALGTHPPMTDEELKAHLGVTFREAKNQGVTVYNHLFQNPQELVHVGTIPREEMQIISRGLIAEDVPVTVNRHILEYDELLIMGPVFPHEVVGFSGGYKYFFPGISGPELTDKFHWLAALITNPKVIGIKDTPVREVLDKAATFIPKPSLALCLVMKGKEPCGIFFGDPKESWSKAADLSAQVNIIYVDQPFHTVLSVAPEMYNELWVGGKCMYKLEPVVADGGKIIIYAPHIREISKTHGKYLLEIGYHTRDFFLAQWEKYKHYPWGVLAHSTHVKGIGKYVNGKEYPRIEVILATGIPEDICRKVNLGYLDFRTINLKEYIHREDEGILFVPRAGETLYRLKDGTVPDIDKLTIPNSSIERPM